ncbi:MAG: YhfC family glutamic-type intramembrane protease [Oscillospiraceae bacterium]
MNQLSCGFMILTAFILPIALGIFMRHRRHSNLRPVLLGVLTFSVSQLFLRIPLLSLLTAKSTWFASVELMQPILYVFIISATAAIFEELGRFLVMKFFLKGRLNLETGVAFGIGHGGIEAIVLVGINAIAFLLTSTFSGPPELMFAAGLERFSTLFIHIGLSVMVMLSLRDKKILWLFAALFLHTAINFFSALLSASIPVFAVEALLLLVAALMALFVFKQYKASLNCPAPKKDASTD